MYLLKSPRPTKVIDFDNTKEYTISSQEFRSWNNDPAFANNGHNAMYFRYTKPYKIKIDFIVKSHQNEKTPTAYGLIDVVSWMPENPLFELRPTALHLLGLKDDFSFRFYVDCFHKNRKEGFFEPRVHKGFHTVQAIRVSKLQTLRVSRNCEYTLFLTRRAKTMLELANQKYQEGDYGLSYHFARFTIEFSLKGIFSALGKQFTLSHHPKEASKQPKADKNLRKQIRDKIPNFPLTKLLWTSQKYSKPSRMDFYGDETGLEPSYKFMDTNEADQALKDARVCYENAMVVFDNFLHVK